MCKVIDLTQKLLSNPVLVAGGILAVSVIALGGAYFSQYALGLEPCNLCIYQRIPYAAAIVLALIALIAHKNRKIAAVIVFFCALSFLINAGIAFYHVGVEQKWWVSAIEGCAVPGVASSPENLLDAIMKAPTARCDEIPWQDPILGISMAGYNALLSFMLFIGCSLAALAIRQRP